MNDTGLASNTAPTKILPDSEQMQQYVAIWRRRRAAQQAEASRLATQARTEAEQIATLLHDQFSATRVILFGSLVRGGFAPGSDIDLAVAGIPKAEFFAALAAANELGQLQRLDLDIQAVRAEIEHDPVHARLFYENLALKLHNFYTGCERIFNLIVAELNGAPVTGFDWHQRLLERMAAAWQDRPAVVRRETAQALREYLGFRHVVRNVYGYELDTERIERLIERYPPIWQAFQADLRIFLLWLNSLADQLDT